MLLQSPKQGTFALDLSFIAPTFAFLLCQFLQLALNCDQIIEQQFGIHRDNIPGRINTAGGVRDRV